MTHLPAQEDLGEEPRHSPAAERNKDAILDRLTQILPGDGTVVEIASGTGQHIVHFAAALLRLSWQPTDPDAELRAAITARAERAALANLQPVLALDVMSEHWPLTQADAVLCINMIHIAPWEACLHMLAGTARLLRPGGVLFVYGPFKREGRHTAPSNAAFDADLRQRDPRWGVRDLEAVLEAAAEHGFLLEGATDMPANNLALIWRRA